MSPRSVASGSAEYAHARMRARWGARPGPAQWHRIEITRELAPLLEQARAGALARWVRDIDPEIELHAAERRLRRHWRDAVDEVAAWLDPPWHDAARWCAVLPYLGAMAQWTRGDAAAHWAADELGGPAEPQATDQPGGPAEPQAAAEPGRPAGAQAAAEAGIGERRATPGASSGLAIGDGGSAPFAAALLALWGAARTGEAGLRAQWKTHWLALMPPGGAKALISQALLPAIDRHLNVFESPATVDGWAARQALAAQLAALMRRHPAEPLEAFVFLALQGLELERLRAELVARIAFPMRTLHA